MRYLWKGLSLALLVVLADPSFADRQARSFRATLNHYNEIPSVNANATGEFRATLSRDESTISFTLSYSNLTGSPSAAHIHIGQGFANGGVAIFLCGGGGQPSCPSDTSATITGTATAANVVAIMAQGLDAGDLASAIRAMRAGKTYANIHTARFPGGEDRGQIMPRAGRGDDGEGDDEGGEHEDD